MRLHWGAGIAAVYLAFATATSGFVFFAMHQPVELVRPDYYEQALAHDAHRRAVARVEALGPRFTCEIAEGGRAIALRLPSEQAGRATGTVWLYRPADSRDDRTIPIAVDAGGRQRIALDGLAQGRWLARVQWTVDGVDYYAEREVTRP
jgi:hypothetical protein